MNAKISSINNKIRVNTNKNSITTNTTSPFCTSSYPQLQQLKLSYPRTPLSLLPQTGERANAKISARNKQTRVKTNKKSIKTSKKGPFRTSSYPQLQQLKLSYPRTQLSLLPQTGIPRRDGTSFGTRWKLSGLGGSRAFFWGGS